MGARGAERPAPPRPPLAPSPHPRRRRRRRGCPAAPRGRPVGRRSSLPSPVPTPGEPALVGSHSRRAPDRVARESRNIVCAHPPHQRAPLAAPQARHVCIMCSSFPLAPPFTWQPRVPCPHRTDILPIPELHAGLGGSQEDGAYNAPQPMGQHFVFKLSLPLSGVRRHEPHARRSPVSVRGMGGHGRSGAGSSSGGAGVCG